MRFESFKSSVSKHRDSHRHPRLLFFGAGLSAHTEEGVDIKQPAEPGRHIDVSDPPPFLIRGERVSEKQNTLTRMDCPLFLSRSGFESGRLSQGVASTPIQFVTAAGFTVSVDRHTIANQDPLEMNMVQHWSDPHENLNGKHIKDWAGSPGWTENRRTVLIDGGAKITMVSAGPQAVVLTPSIYDGHQSVQIDNNTNTIAHYSTDAVVTADRDAAQYDGETVRFTVDMITAIASYTNVYNEDEAFTKAVFNIPLGVTGGCANPTLTNDYYDDPRLGRT